jgi:hypothetical protein
MHTNKERPNPLRLKRADLRDVNVIAWAIFAFVVAIALQTSLRKGDERDFVYFYSIGHLLNHYSPARLYDFELQKHLVSSMQPEMAGTVRWGVFAYPPHLAMLFQPFAMLPYWSACRLWLSISLTLYVTGLCLLIGRFFKGDRLERSLVLCFGMLFWPFISWVLLGGQLSSIGFLAMALALYWEDSGRYFQSGLALAICTYKPTLLVLILPMLLVVRRTKTLAGFAIGAVTFVTLATLEGGPQIWADYFAASVRYSAGIRRVSPATLDLRSFSQALPHSNIVFAVAGCVIAACLAGIWWRARNYAQHGPISLLWATTITWTLLLNLYVPIYDSVQVLISMIATAGILIRYAPRIYFGLAFALLVCSYAGTWAESQLSWQLLTPVTAAIGIFQMAACLRESKSTAEIEGNRAMEAS